MIDKKYSKRLMDKYPSIYHLEQKAKRKIPNLAWEYLQSGTGKGDAVFRNRRALSDITFNPQFLKGKFDIDISTNLFNKTYHTPFGIAPIGLSGLIWPKSELILAQTAKKYEFPFCLSTVATQNPESVGPLVGEMGWFQLYAPKEYVNLIHLLKRAKKAGFHTLVITVDVPTLSRREQSRASGFRIPPKVTPKLLWDALMHPEWFYKTLKTGFPHLKTVENYCPSKDIKTVAEFTRFKFRADLDWEYIQRVRELWAGPIILKGILHASDATKAVALGIDGIGVSNHGGRQFDGASAAINALPSIVKGVNGKAKIIFDSGISSGLDIIRAIALGADFVLVGRAFMYGCAALGAKGGNHTANILIEDLKNNMKQLGISTIQELKSLKQTNKTSC